MNAPRPASDCRQRPSALGSTRNDSRPTTRPRDSQRHRAAATASRPLECQTSRPGVTGRSLNTYEEFDYGKVITMKQVFRFEGEEHPLGEFRGWLAADPARAQRILEGLRLMDAAEAERRSQDPNMPGYYTRGRHIDVLSRPQSGVSFRTTGRYATRVRK